VWGLEWEVQVAFNALQVQQAAVVFTLFLLVNNMMRSRISESSSVVVQPLNYPSPSTHIFIIDFVDGVSVYLCCIAIFTIFPGLPLSLYILTIPDLFYPHSTLFFSIV
jgi:hypothetical protein